MGHGQSRIKSTDSAEPHDPAAMPADGPKIRIRASPDLVEDLRSGTSVSSQQKGRNVDEEALQRAYQQGAHDYRKHVEERQEQLKQELEGKNRAYLKEREVNEEQRVKEILSALNEKRYRAPQGIVKCAKERDACLKCYRDKKEGETALDCSDVATIFINCAKDATQDFVSIGKDAPL